MVEAAQVFAQQAKAAGVTVNVKKLDSRHVLRRQVPQVAVRHDYWGTRHYLDQVAAGSLPDSPFNETHWATRVQRAATRRRSRTVDAESARAASHEMQKIEYDDGGYIIWGFYNLIDALQQKVAGFEPTRARWPAASATLGRSTHGARAACRGVACPGACAVLTASG